MTDDKKRIAALRRRVAKARKFPTNTCAASRHLQMIADGLLSKRGYPMLAEEPAHCAETMLAVLASLWELRNAEADRARACEKCGKTDKVTTSTGFPASEHWCARCKIGWMAPC